MVGAPERIRTSDPQIRSLVLYPAELRARLEGANLLGSPRKGKNYPPPVPAMARQALYSVPNPPKYRWIHRDFRPSGICSLVGLAHAG